MSILTDAVSQLTNIYKTLSDFHKALFTSVSDTTGSVEYPMFADTSQFIDYSELVRSSMRCQRDIPKYANGATIETVHHAAAVLRESAMCHDGKLAYVSRQSMEALNEYNFYIKQGMFMSSTLQGNSSGGSVA